MHGILAKNEGETHILARSFFEELLKKTPVSPSQGGDGKTHATVVGLYGDLGAGKTFFTKEVARLLGVEEAVQSPTFVIERIYALENRTFEAQDGEKILIPFERFIHIDAYRLETEDELAHLGWDDILENKNNLIFIEWAERVEGLLPKDAIKIMFKHKEAGPEEGGETKREIIIQKN